jgi:Carboxypeptidase regulatory-like domain
MCALVWLLPGQLTAQTSISGFVRDSLAGKPLVGAVIQLVPSATPWAAGRTVKSDSIGRFAIDSVAPGQYVFGFQHPRLDSLGLDAVSKALQVDKAVRFLRADLALPSGRTFVTMLCGPRADSSGAVIGRVFNADDGAPVAVGSVVVHFAKMRIDAGGVRKVPMQVVAPFGTDGRFVACGIPTDAAILAQARAGTGDATGKAGMSGEIEMAFEPKVPLLHRDLLIAMRDADSVPTASVPAGGVKPAAPRATVARTGSARISGRVNSSDGKPVKGARVSVQDTDISMLTDSSGMFRGSGLPAGTRTVEVVAIGFAPVRLAADLRANRETTVPISVGSRITTLGAVNVIATPDRAGFLKRRAAGLGYFLDANQMEQRGAQNIAMALTTAPALRNNGFSVENPTRPRISGRNNCKPVAYLDGQQIQDGLGGIDDLLTIRRVGGIEVYADATEAPPQFHGQGNCAIVIVWTKSYVP